MSTFPTLVAELLRADAARPLVTFYDDATGERIELSVATYANWVSKTAGLLQDELDAERGGLLLVHLPTHWLGAVWLGAAWTLGMRVTDDPAAVGSADVVVCGPDGVQRYAGAAGDVPVVALSLRPLGGRFTEPLPTGVVDYGSVVLAQPDLFTPYDAPDGTDLAWDEDGATWEALLAAAAADDLVGPGGRLLTDANPCTRSGLRTLLVPLARGGAAVWVRHSDRDRWAKRATDERATAELQA